MDSLDQNPDDAGALFQLSAILIDQGRRGLAYNVLARGCKLQPDIPEMWLNFGRAHSDDPAGWPKSEWCFKKAIKLGEKQGKQLPLAWANLATLSNEQCKYDQALKYAEKCLEIDPHYRNALVTRSFTYLAQGRWAEAWPGYRLMLDTGRREQYGYGNTSEWEGFKGQSVIVSGEQGIGDEIMYASCFQDLFKDCSQVVIECMPRLKNLFERSFPEATAVIPTRWEKQLEWPAHLKLPDYHVAMATLPRFYRNLDGDFPGKPYLVPDKDMVDAFQGMLAKLGSKPKVGIAWTGGLQRTRGYLRTRTLEELTPILRQDVDWISLEYNDRTDEISEYYAKRKIGIHTFPWITAKGLDYDLTAALVSCLDLVITVPTTVSQMAGALGVDCWVLVPKYTGWIFARDVYPWANSVTPMRNPPIMDVAKRLESWLSTRTPLSKAV